MLKMNIRPFAPTDADYEATVRVHNTALPEYCDSVQDWRHWDDNRPAHCKAERWLVELDGAVVAQGGFYQFPGMYHPHKFFVDMDVTPAAQGRGVGQALFGHLLQRVAPHNPIALRSDCREDVAAANHILRKHGFVEEMKFWDARLDVASFDPRPFADHERKVLERGITICTLRDLMDQGDDYKRPLYEVIDEIGHDVPSPDEHTTIPFEQWVKTNLEYHNLLPEGYFIAMHEGAIVGVSQLWTGADPDMLYTGLTGTRRSHRRMGIALALKLRAIAFAQQRGTRAIRTGNETRNKPMISINEALGFVKLPVWTTYLKQL